MPIYFSSAGGVNASAGVLLIENFEKFLVMVVTIATVTFQYGTYSMIKVVLHILKIFFNFLTRIKVKPAYNVRGLWLSNIIV